MFEFVEVFALFGFGWDARPSVPTLEESAVVEFMLTFLCSGARERGIVELEGRLRIADCVDGEIVLLGTCVVNVEDNVAVLLSESHGGVFLVHDQTLGERKYPIAYDRKE